MRDSRYKVLGGRYRIDVDEIFINLVYADSLFAPCFEFFINSIVNKGYESTIKQLKSISERLFGKEVNDCLFHINNRFHEGTRYYLEADLETEKNTYKHNYHDKYAERFEFVEFLEKCIQKSSNGIYQSLKDKENSARSRKLSMHAHELESLIRVDKYLKEIRSLKRSHKPFDLHIKITEKDIVGRAFGLAKLEFSRSLPSSFMKSVYAFEHCPLQIISANPPFIQKMLKLGGLDALKVRHYFKWQEAKVTFYKGKITGLSFYSQRQIPHGGKQVCYRKVS